MMERLGARGREIARARAAALVERLAAAIGEEAPRDVHVSAEPDGVVLSGRRLLARSFRDARLRGFAVLARSLGWTP